MHPCTPACPARLAQRPAPAPAAAAAKATSCCSPATDQLSAAVKAFGELAHQLTGGLASSLPAPNAATGPPPSDTSSSPSPAAASTPSPNPSTTADPFDHAWVTPTTHRKGCNDSCADLGAGWRSINGGTAGGKMVLCAGLIDMPDWGSSGWQAGPPTLKQHVTSSVQPSPVGRCLRVQGAALIGSRPVVATPTLLRMGQHRSRMPFQSSARALAALARSATSVTGLLQTAALVAHCRRSHPRLGRRSPQCMHMSAGTLPSTLMATRVWGVRTILAK